MFPSQWSHHISIAVVLNFATLITFFATNNSHQSPFRFIMIYPETVVVNIMACRVFRNVKFGRHSQILIIPTQINTGSLTQHDYNPDMGGENSYHIGDMNMPLSVDVSRQNKSAKLPTPDFHRQGIEKPNKHLGGVEVTKVIEFTRSWRRVWRFIDIHSCEALLTNLSCRIDKYWSEKSSRLKRGPVCKKKAYIRTWILYFLIASSSLSLDLFQSPLLLAVSIMDLFSK